MLDDLSEMGEGLPHARGGVSAQTRSDPKILLSSPRPWGCFRQEGSDEKQWHVFPTPVGVFPKLVGIYVVAVCLPHARGGVSKNRLCT